MGLDRRTIMAQDTLTGRSLDTATAHRTTHRARLCIASCLGALLLAGQGSANAADSTEELLATDRAFSTESQAQGRIAAFAHYAAPGALMFRPGGPPIEGVDAIRSSMARQGPGNLTWAPHAASVASSGDLGYTWGDYTFSPGDTHKVYTGTYVSIWRRQGDGHWKWVVDIGNPGPEAAE
jgi:ketosteroid isomerase-like protein